MKKLLILIFSLLSLFSLNSFSQSYIVLKNGVTLTISKEGFLYDLNHFFLPYHLTSGGGQFFFFNDKLVTVDASGLLYEKSLRVEDIKTRGANYFVNEDRDLITIDSKGYFYKFQSRTRLFRRIFASGGNFFLVKSSDNQNNDPSSIDLYTVTSLGNYFKIDVPGLNLASIRSLGGNYFQTTSGEVYTISHEGFVFNKSGFGAAEIIQKGGNFFIDSKGMLFTVAENGFLLLPSLPAGLNIKNIKIFGHNYMVDNDGKMFTISHLGEIFERNTEHNLKEIKLFSNFESNSATSLDL